LKKNVACVSLIKSLEDFVACVSQDNTPFIQQMFVRNQPQKGRQTRAVLGLQLRMHYRREE